MSNVKVMSRFTLRAQPARVGPAGSGWPRMLEQLEQTAGREGQVA